MTADAELSSVSSSLEELAVRIARIAEGLDLRERDLVGPDLFEVERSLRSAHRRLSRLMDRRRS